MLVQEIHYLQNKTRYPIKQFFLEQRGHGVINIYFVSYNLDKKFNSTLTLFVSGYMSWNTLLLTSKLINLKCPNKIGCYLDQNYGYLKLKFYVSHNTYTQYAQL